MRETCPRCEQRVELLDGRFARHGTMRRPCCTSGLEAGEAADRVAAAELRRQGEALDGGGDDATRQRYPAIARRADEYRARAAELEAKHLPGHGVCVRCCSTIVGAGTYCRACRGVGHA